MSSSEKFSRESSFQAHQRRRQTKETLVATMVAYARENGLVAWKDDKRLKEAFPSVPDTFLFDVWAEMDTAEVNSFLDDLSKTVEAEIIRRAISGDAVG